MVVLNLKDLHHLFVFPVVIMRMIFEKNFEKHGSQFDAHNTLQVSPLSPASIIIIITTIAMVTTLKKAPPPSPPQEARSAFHDFLAPVPVCPSGTGSLIRVHQSLSGFC